MRMDLRGDGGSVVNMIKIHCIKISKINRNVIKNK